ncbi:MAG: bifunctional phosphoribosyl-AMP cyclohydrolase/phosphoribosyl-ATP diphosphatase HisIE [Saprospiraceae bacterium]
MNFTINQLDFQKGDGLIPVIIQDNTTNKVLMLGYMNADALEKTIMEKRVTFFSRSKQRLWTKGESSGNFLNLVSIAKDCDNDTILIKANPVGPVCHTGADTCFEETNQKENFLLHLENVIQDRRDNPSGKSYTTSLFKKGINKVAQKVGEEAVELVIEAKDDNKDLFMGEAADLMYHYLVLLAAKNYTLTEVIDVLKERHK